MTATLIVLAASGVFTLLAAYTDVRTSHIPNRLIVVGFVLSVVLHIGVHVLLLRSPERPLTTLLASAGANMAAGLLVCALVPFVLYRARAMGGGDVKLLAVVGVCVGPVLGLQVELTAFLVALVYALARMAYDGQLLGVLARSAALALNPLLPKTKRREVPDAALNAQRFAPAVFAGTLLTLATRWGS